MAYGNHCVQLSCNCDALTTDVGAAASNASTIAVDMATTITMILTDTVAISIRVADAIISFISRYPHGRLHYSNSSICFESCFWAFVDGIPPFSGSGLAAPCHARPASDSPLWPHLFEQAVLVRLWQFGHLVTCRSELNEVLES